MDIQQIDKKLLGKNSELNRKIIDLKDNRRIQQRNNKIHNYFQQENIGYLEAENENEKTLQFRQDQLKQLLPLGNVKNIFKLDLNFGNYKIDYSRDGKCLLLGSSMGHVSLINIQKKEMKCEFHVKEQIKDVAVLKDEGLYCLAQKKYAYIYDDQGVEIHRLKQFSNPILLQYLPYHYLLSGVSQQNILSYLDISTGQLVNQFKMQNQFINTLTHNPQNAVLVLGDNSGQLAFYTPNTAKPVVSIFAHKGNVQTVQITQNGYYMASTGNDNLLKIWDIRQLKEVFEYYNGQTVKSSSISQTGLLALGFDKNVEIWKDYYLVKQKRAYMKQESQKKIRSVKYIPFQDYLGIGEENGYEQIVIPGSGEVFYDSFEVNLFQSKKQKRESDIKKLLDKLPASTIMMNINQIGNIDNASAQVLLKEQESQQQEEQEQQTKKKTRGISKKQKRITAKSFVYDEKTAAQLKEFLRNRKKIKNIERERQSNELDLLQNLTLNSNFDPLKVIKKIKKLN